VLGGGLAGRPVGRAAAWQEQPPEAAPGGQPALPQSCALQPYTGCPNNLRVNQPSADGASGCQTCAQSCPADANGQAQMCADVAFFAALDAICACAAANSVVVLVESAYRQAGQQVPGSGFVPAGTSNHHAGHAIDAFVEYADASGQTQVCRTPCLANPPAPVASFNQCLQLIAGLRCCGAVADSTGSPDWPHIDDGLNQGCPTSCPPGFLDRRSAVQQSGPCPAGQVCDLGTGICAPGPAERVCGMTCCPPGQTCEVASGACVPCPTERACGGACCAASEACNRGTGQCEPCPAAQVCGADGCCAEDQTCRSGMCCPPQRVCGARCCLEGESCTTLMGCCPTAQVCEHTCCAPGAQCVFDDRFGWGCRGG